MGKEIHQLYSMINGGELTFDECQKINKALAAVKYDEIPKEQFANVKDYLIAVLNHDEVETSLIKDLDKLLGLLQ